MKLTTLFSMAGISFLAVAALPTQLPAQGGSATSERNGGPTHFNLTDLGVVGPPPGQPFHLTDNGLITGSEAVGNAEHAILQYRRLTLDIGARGLGGANSVSFGMNRWAQAVGGADTHTPDPLGEDFCGFATLGFASGTRCLPFLWQNGMMRALPTLKDKNGQHGNNGTANVINSYGEVTGDSENMTLDPTCPPYDPSKGQTQKLQQKPVIWRAGRVYELPVIGGDPDGDALAINDRGQVAGGTGTCAAFNLNNFIAIQFAHAVLWDNGKPIDLGNLGGQFNNLATGINERGDVVGGSDVATDATTNGFLWTKEKHHMDPLLPVDTDILSVALAVNDKREVTGVSLQTSFLPRAVLWHHEVPFDLNTLIPSSSRLFLMTACSVNDSGQIVGLAVDSNGVFHGYLATPRGDRDSHDAALDGPMKLSDNVREMVRKQLHFDHSAPGSRKTAP
jgi:probable HAF family extracellular repeat protein